MHGKIKQYSEQQNLSIEEAYLNLLGTGLDSTSTTEEISLRRSVHTKSRFIPCSEVVHGRLCTFHPYTLSGSVAFRTADTTQPLDQVEHILAELQRFAGIDSDRGVFTVQQSNGVWIGRGLSTFFETLGNQESRYEAIPDDFTLKTHHSEAAFFVSSAPAGPSVAPRGPSAVTVSAQPVVDGEAVDHFRIALATSGVPVDPQKIDELGNRIGIDIGYGQQHNPVQIHVPRNKCTEIEIEPVQKITEENYREEWVTDLICKNPFYQNPEKLTEYLKEGTDRDVNFSLFQDYIIHNKYIWCDLAHHHQARKQPKYIGRTLRLDDLDQIGGSGFGAINLYFAGTYVD